MTSLKRKEAVAGYLFLSPWLVGFSAFMIGPIIASLYFSFCDYRIGFPIQWVGLGNYTELAHDPAFWKSLRVSFFYTLVGVPLRMVLALMLAILLNQKVRCMSLFRTLLYLPAVVSGVAVALLWVWFLSRDGAGNMLLSYVFNVFGPSTQITPPSWLGDPTWIPWTFIMMSTWGVGGTMLIYLAGLQSVPTSLYEAATVDGASVWSQFCHVTLPMISPVLLFNLIMSIIHSWQVFAPAYIVTNGTGGPKNAGLFYVLYLFINAFDDLKMGYGCAMAWILFAIILSLTLVMLKTSDRWVYYEGVKR